ncbi:MAG: energy-coupling factor transporter transmembrane protein EcfT [Clostridia bacterium]|nr:energy-coupling factor transporter transmembrane protein EcfT [Clostridia bacterium]
MRFALLERINPFVKVVTILICGIILAFTKSWKLDIAVMVVCLAILVFGTRCKWSTLFKTFIPALLIAAAVFYSGLVFGKPDNSIDNIYSAATMGAALLMGSRILAYVSLGLMFILSSDQEEFVISLMQQGHVKPKFAYGVLAALNLLPTLQQEWKEVCLAYQVRGKKTGLLPIGPLFNTLVNSIRWSENVAMAMESKGFDGDGVRTFFVVTKVTAGDICFSIICFALTLAGMIFV